MTLLQTTQERTVQWVRRVKASEPDSYGDDAYTDQSSNVTVLFTPGASTENTNAQDQVITQPTYYLPAQSVPAPGDAIHDGDDTWEVQGQPEAWPQDTDGWPPYPVVVRVKRVTG